MKFILGTKKEMTRRFKPSGEVIPLTVIQAGPCFITQIKAKAEKTGIQIGYGQKKKLDKPTAGHLAGLQNFRYLREFKEFSSKFRFSFNC